MKFKRLILLFVLSAFLFQPLAAVSVRGQVGRDLEIPLEGAEVLKLNSEITRVALGNPKLGEVSVVSTREILILGRKRGATTLHVWTDGGLRKFNLQISDRPRRGQVNKEGLLRELGVVDESGKELRLFKPRYRDLEDFEEYFKELLGDEGEIVLSDKVAGHIYVLAPPKLLNKIEDLLDRLDVPDEQVKFTRRIKLQNRPVNEMKEKVQEMLSEEGKTIMDEETNSLMVVDKVDKVKEIANFLESIDVKTVAQVRIEAKFVEMTDEAEKQIGINWGYDGSVDGQSLEASMKPELPGIDSVGGLQLGLADEVGKSLNATMQFLESEGLANLISSPNVMTRNQQEAKLEIVNEKSYTAGWNVSQTDGGGLNVTPMVETKQGGITLKTTPLIGQSDVVQLNLDAELKLLRLGEPIVQEAAGNQYPFYTPTVDRRTAQLNVALKDGQTLVIGGLNREETSSNKDEVPLLGKIPLIGPMIFGQSSDAMENRKITIFLTADIIQLNDEPVEEDIAGPQEVTDTVPEETNLFAE